MGGLLGPLGPIERAVCKLSQPILRDVGKILGSLWWLVRDNHCEVDFLKGVEFAALILGCAPPPPLPHLRNHAAAQPAMQPGKLVYGWRIRLR